MYSPRSWETEQEKRPDLVQQLATHGPVLLYLGSVWRRTRGAASRSLQAEQRKATVWGPTSATAHLSCGTVLYVHTCFTSAFSPEQLKSVRTDHHEAPAAEATAPTFTEFPLQSRSSQHLQNDALVNIHSVLYHVLYQSLTRFQTWQYQLYQYSILFNVTTIMKTHITGRQSLQWPDALQAPGDMTSLR